MLNLNDYENDFLSSIYNKESEFYKKAIDSLIEEKNNIWNQFNKSVNQKIFSEIRGFMDNAMDGYNKRKEKKEFFEKFKK